jgi:hypothetical protein
MEEQQIIHVCDGWDVINSKGIYHFDTSPSEQDILDKIAQQEAALAEEQSRREAEQIVEQERQTVFAEVDNIIEARKVTIGLNDTIDELIASKNVVIKEVADLVIAKDIITQEVADLISAKDGAALPQERIP